MFWKKIDEYKIELKVRAEVIKEMKEWYLQKIEQASLQDLVIKTTERIISKDLQNSVRKTSNDIINSEAFIDKIINRIKRKQLK